MSNGSVNTDLEIASQAKLLPIEEVASLLTLKNDDLIHYGPHKAKIKLESVKAILNRPLQGKLVLVTAITPTPAGEGKTTVSIGLTQALRKLKKNATVALREPSLGPCFGVKGGAAGGGYSQVLPMEDINLHFTGDIHAVTASHNLIAALLENHLYHSKQKTISVRDIFWKRVMDMNDRSLRSIITGIGQNGLTREAGFEITAASEIMAILCLAMNYDDLKTKIGNILIGLELGSKNPIFAKDLNAQGAATALLKEALLPNLVQTIENGPAFIHGGPFANIAQGTSSILATNLALRLSDYVVTEAGFGCDLGAEKFFDIVSQYGQFSPAATVIVASVKALKMHGGVKKKDLSGENVNAVLAGAPNLEKHIENAKKFNVEVIVAINKFPQDTEAELNAVAQICQNAEVSYSIIDVWGKGGDGAIQLAEQVLKCTQSENKKATSIYRWEESVETKITKIATEIYGAKDVYYYPKAKKDLELIDKCNFSSLPVCIAKTQNSLSDNPSLIGRPKDFTLSVREIIISSGAGFLVPLTGEIMRMPGLPLSPSAEQIDIDNDGRIHGLF